MTIEDIIRENRKAEHRFFDPFSMEFFRTRVHSRVYHAHAEAIAFFVTSDRDYDGRRRYSVRRFDATTGGVETTGKGFGRYATRSAAHNAAFILSNEARR